MGRRGRTVEIGDSFTRKEAGRHQPAKAADNGNNSVSKRPVCGVRNAAFPINPGLQPSRFLCWSLGDKAFTFQLRQNDSVCYSENAIDESAWRRRRGSSN